MPRKAQPVAAPPLNIREKCDAFGKAFADQLYGQIEKNVDKLIQSMNFADLSSFVGWRIAEAGTPTVETPPKILQLKGDDLESLAAVGAIPSLVKRKVKQRTRAERRQLRQVELRSRPGTAPVETMAKKKRKSGPRTCRNCGQVGVLTKTCGITHNVTRDSDGEIVDRAAPKPAKPAAQRPAVTSKAPRTIAKVSDSPKPWRAVLERTKAARAQIDDPDEDEPEDEDDELDPEAELAFDEDAA